MKRQKIGNNSYGDSQPKRALDEHTSALLDNVLVRAIHTRDITLANNVRYGVLGKLSMEGYNTRDYEVIFDRLRNELGHNNGHSALVY